MGRRTELKRKTDKITQRFMYTNEKDELEWRKSQDERRADVSQDNARDIVEAIDKLIDLKIRIELAAAKGFLRGNYLDEVELLKRQITDYLLVTDPRAGVFRKPE